MRCTQPMGFSAGGIKFLDKFKFKVREKGIRIFPDGTEESFDRMNLHYSALQTEPSGETSGMFDENDLLEYITKDGEVFTEYIQYCEWSSGPMEFYALKDESGEPIKETLWTQEELDAELLHEEILEE